MTSFEQTYPFITRWVKQEGWIEIGYDGMSHSWIRVLDEGGMIWEDGDSSKTMDEALQTLEGVLAGFFRGEMRL